jgi:methylenetetrahydrofolate--tRNA-(uracil-5-)-methyltransferase
MQLRARPGVFLAGQITGVEGYVESCAGGNGHPLAPPPETTALGGIRTHLMRPNERFQPSNITWACMPPSADRRLKKRDRYQFMSERALVDLDAWLASAPLARRS